MKSIILTEIPYHYDTVYPPALRERICGLADTDAALCRKGDILADPAAYADVEVIFSTWGMPSFSEEELAACLPSLKYLFYAAGSVQSFARPFLRRGVRVFSAWAANAVPVAEYTVAQIILAGKDFYCQTALLSERRFSEAAARRGAHLGSFRKRVGLIGCGMIGSLVARMLRAYDLEVAVCDPFLSAERAAELGVTVCSPEELFATSAVVSNHLANNPETRGMLRYEHFSSMPPYATFINTGRGAQVVEADLVRALSERPDLVAVLDVTDPEPSPPDHPFYDLPNCFLTPHVAGSLGGEVVRMAEYMVAEFEAILEGRPVAYEVTLPMLATMA